MSIQDAIDQIAAGTQMPSSPWMNTGLSDAVYWHEVREWLAAIAAAADQCELADAWEAGESAGQDNAHAYRSAGEVTRNPYRPTK